MRAYLITRLERLLSSRWVAVAVTIAVFASYHVYEGAAGDPRRRQRTCLRGGVLLVSKTMADLRCARNP